MKLVDANVLIYAVNEDDPRHAEARGWLDSALTGTETIGFSWTVLLAFLRLVTKHGLFPRPLPVEDALSIVGEWLDADPAVTVDPSPRHLVILESLLATVGTGGNLVTDGHLAALSLETRATVVTYDSDFGRFEGLRWATPAQLAV